MLYIEGIVGAVAIADGRGWTPLDAGDTMPRTDANDNIPPATGIPDASGAAALSLVESLVHHLVNRSVISLAEAIDVVQIAADAQAEISLERGYEPSTKPDALTLLSAISASLAIDAV